MIQDVTAPIEKNDSSGAEKSAAEPVLSLQDEILSLLVEEKPSVATPDVTEAAMKVDVVRQPSPPPVLADVQNLVSDITIPPPQCGDSTLREPDSLPDELLRAESPLEVHIVRSLSLIFFPHIRYS